MTRAVLSVTSIFFLIRRTRCRPATSSTCVHAIFVLFFFFPLPVLWVNLFLHNVIHSGYALLRNTIRVNYKHVSRPTSALFFFFSVIVCALNACKFRRTLSHKTSPRDLAGDDVSIPGRTFVFFFFANVTIVRSTIFYPVGLGSEREKEFSYIRVKRESNARRPSDNKTPCIRTSHFIYLKNKFLSRARSAVQCARCSVILIFRSLFLPLFFLVPFSRKWFLTHGIRRGLAQAGFSGQDEDAGD